MIQIQIQIQIKNYVMTRYSTITDLILFTLVVTTYTVRIYEFAVGYSHHHASELIPKGHVLALE